MHLKKLELFGFKSFAERTEVVFEKGVTCIVGPNGCGKSNISDAIRWVLGERSAKLLRGTRMEDVIFNGTDFRKPLNLAEVSLTIDNQDSKLPIQYQEVVITRRLHRSGESEYLINRTPCRLKDIQDLILDTGIGSNSYSMIEQGRIDYVLSAESEERRFLIEEAAGISKYKVKKEEAIRKLERTDENLTRLNDIVSEVERNIRYAERQANRAQKHKEELERLKALEVRKAFYKLSSCDQRLAELNQERNRVHASLAELEKTHAFQNVAVRQLDQTLHELENQFFDQEGLRSEAKQKIINAENHEKFCREKIETLKLSAEKALGEIESAQKRFETLETEVNQRSQERSQLLIEIDSLGLQKNEALLLADQARAAYTVSLEAFKTAQTSIFDLAQEIAEKRNRLNQTRFEQEALSRTLIAQTESSKKILETIDVLTERLHILQEEQGGHIHQSEQAHQKLNRVRDAKERTGLTLSESRLRLDEYKKEKEIHEKEILILTRSSDPAAVDPQKILFSETVPSNAQTAVKTLLDFIEVEAGYEHAVESVLADSLRAMVTDNLESAAHLIGRLKEAKPPHAIIVIKDRANLNGHLSRKSPIETHPLIEKRLWDVVRVASGYEAIFANLISDVYVVSEVSVSEISPLFSLDPKVKLVTKSGILFDSEFQVVLRNGYSPSAENAWIQRERLEKCRNKVNELSFEIERLTTLSEQQEHEIKARGDEESFLVEERFKVQTTMERTNGIRLGLQEQLKNLQEELKLIQLEEAQNRRELSEGTLIEEKLSSDLNYLEEKERALRSDAGKIDELAQRERTKSEAIEKKQISLETALELRNSKDKDLSAAIELLNTQALEFHARIQSLAADREHIGSEIETLTSQLEGLGKEKESLHQTLFSRSLELEQTKEKRAQLFAQRDQTVQASNQSSRELDQVRQKLYELNLKEMETTHEIDSIRQDIGARYRLNLAEIDPKPFPLTFEELPKTEEEIERLRSKLEAGGPVNLLAIDEYNELKTRYDFLNAQRNDLIAAKESLLEAIRKINRTTKKLFDETLIRVREGFKEYFRVLFGGGQADLILLDETNPLDSGLDIIARPPGKKMQHVSLLSGGEKAMTAIALLLALFSVKPSPFCVLDEVDAPLDEANNERFLTVLKPFLGTTQFIIVTHSRKTIAMGDSLYGVTMEEAGVSKMVSVRLTQNQSLTHENTEVAAQLNQVLVN